MIDGNIMVQDATFTEYGIGRNHRAGQDLSPCADFRCGVDGRTRINQGFGSQTRGDHPGLDVDPIATATSPDRHQSTDVVHIESLCYPLRKPSLTDV
jgi:hypothetical protein